MNSLRSPSRRAQPLWLRRQRDPNTLFTASKGKTMLGKLSAALAVTLVLSASSFAQTASSAQATRTPASSEPTIHQIYEAANSGELAQANALMATVLAAHPGSAKAHFVHAELLAREGNLAAAKSELATAKELAPGLPFAKPEAIEQLMRSLEPVAASPAAQPITGVAAANPFIRALQGPRMLLILLGVCAIGFLVRRSIASPAAPPAPRPTPSSAAWQGAFGAGRSTVPPVAPAAPHSIGLGSALATGAAMGIGAVVAEEAWRRMTRERPAHEDQSASDEGNTWIGRGLWPAAASDASQAMGGTDFGIKDSSSWGGGASGTDGGSDWSSDS
jgi:hypothetical protein